MSPTSPTATHGGLLLEREGAFQALEQALVEATAGRGRLAFVAGEASPVDLLEDR